MNSPSWVEEYLVSAERRSLSPRSIECYKRVLSSFINDWQLDLSTCNKEDLLHVYDGMRAKYSPFTVRLNLTIMKMVLKHLGRKELVETIEYPRLPDRTEKIMAQVLKPEEVEQLIRKAPSLQDRLIIELLSEVGGRLGELHKLRIKDIQFETVNGKETAILVLTGKSGTRRRRIYQAVPDLRTQINNNPGHDNPDASLLLLANGKPMTDDSFYQRVRMMGKEILHRNIHPHQFRHTAATKDSRFYTDREMMQIYGWKSPTMVGVYSHLSSRDVDDKDLILHGLKSKEEILKPIMEIRVCPKCKAENAPIALYCHKCGIVLSSNVEITEELALKVMQNAPLVMRVLKLMEERNLRAGEESSS
jgi:integrase